MRNVKSGWQIVRNWLPKIGPYLAVEIVLPGGTLVALTLYLYRRLQPAATRD